MGWGTHTSYRNYTDRFSFLMWSVNTKDHFNDMKISLSLCTAASLCLSLAELLLGRWFWLTTACSLTSCKTIDLTNVKMSIRGSCFCFGFFFYFQSNQLFTFCNQSVRLTFCAYQWSCQVMLLIWVKLLHEKKDIWKAPQDRRVVSFWMCTRVQSEDRTENCWFSKKF